MLARTLQISLNLLWVLNPLGHPGGLERPYPPLRKSQRTGTLKSNLKGPGTRPHACHPTSRLPGATEWGFGGQPVRSSRALPGVRPGKTLGGTQIQVVRGREGTRSQETLFQRIL